LAILAITDLALPAYHSAAMVVVTYGAMCLPVFLGRLLRGARGGWDAAWRWAVCGLVPATLFYLITNLAVWAFESNYPKTMTGLVECYWAAVPFYRWMTAGDVFYLAVVFGCWALAGIRLPSRRRAHSPSSSHVLSDRDSSGAHSGGQPSSARLVRMH
jgi:hypothetical protein